MTEHGNFMLSFFKIDFGSPGSTLSESARCTRCIFERLEKFKMASKMSAVSDNSLHRLGLLGGNHGEFCPLRISERVGHGESPKKALKS